MRRTDFEFKEEVLRRAEAYRQRRKKRVKMIAAICLPVVMCGGGLLALLSMGMGGSTMGVAMESDKSAQYVEAPAAAAPAPESIEEECAMDSVMDMEPGEGNMQSGKMEGYVISITVASVPEQEEYARAFTDKEHNSAILEAINAFQTDSETIIAGKELEDREGLAYVITVTWENRIGEYVLFSDALLAEEIWYINPECYRTLEKLIQLEGN